LAKYKIHKVVDPHVNVCLHIRVQLQTFTFEWVKSFLQFVFRMFWALFSSWKTSSTLSNLHDSSMGIHQILYLIFDYPSFTNILLLSRLEVQYQVRNLFVEDPLQHSCSHFSQADVLDVWRGTLPCHHTKVSHVHTLNVKNLF
jgi:hypothetical protein